MTATGFENVPTTTALMFFTMILTVAIGNSTDVDLNVSEVLRGQVWRLLTSHFAFKNMAQAFVGIVILYSSRHFERQLGMKKYAAFAVISYILSMLMQIIATLILNALGFENIDPAQGPYFIIFALLHLYYDKTLIYILAAQLLFNDGIRSIESGLIGLLIGNIYDRNVCGIQRIRLPSAVERSLSFVTHFFSSASPERTAPRAAAQMPPTATNPNFFGHDDVYSGGWDNFGGDAGFMPRAPPSEEAIQTLVSMGFDRNTVLQALESTNNNVEAAANRLLR